MGIETALIASAIAGVAGAGYSMYSGERQAKEQKKAQRQAEKEAERQAREAEQNANRSRNNQPNAAMDTTAQAGSSSTMLTGPGGVDPNQLNLGKNTLLGS